MKKLSLMLCAFLLLALCACTRQLTQGLPVQAEAVENPAQEASAPEKPISSKTDTPPTGVSQEAPAVSSRRSQPFTGCITLWVDSDTALVNSEPVQILAAPFVENDIFYIPLQFVAETMGWEYQYEDGTVELRSAFHHTTLSVGQRAISIDGIQTSVRDFYRKFTADEAYGEQTGLYVPIDRDGIIFIPYDYLSALTDDDTFQQLSFRSRMFPNDGYVLLSSYEKEDGIGGFYVWDVYDSLSEEQRAGMEELGVVGVSRDAYDVVEYGANGLFVHVLRLQNGCENVEGLDGVISAVYTTNPDIPTPRGLRVGDPISQIYRTYESDFFMQLLCITEDDVITKIRFFSYYDEDETILRQPQKLYMDAAEAGSPPSSE